MFLLQNKIVRSKPDSQTLVASNFYCHSGIGEKEHSLSFANFTELIRPKRHNPALTSRICLCHCHQKDEAPSCSWVSRWYISALDEKRYSSLFCWITHSGPTPLHALLSSITEFCFERIYALQRGMIYMSWLYLQQVRDVSSNAFWWRRGRHRNYYLHFFPFRWIWAHKKKNIFLLAGVSVLMFIVIITKSNILTSTAQVARVLTAVDTRGDER